jgi:succinoglycan biosynthesis protein ExoV
MQLHYAKIKKMLPGSGNFGDDLNPWLFPRLLPDVFDNDKRVGFVGIGTILTEKMPKFERTIIFGTGHGFFAPPKADETWTIYCVRGPLTARAMNLDPSLGIADPGILVQRQFDASRYEKEYAVSYVPHVFEVHNTEPMIRRICERLGYHFIDPRWPIETVLEHLAKTKLLLTEAMHGAIAADALRVPWLPVKTNAGIPDYKWNDWCDSMEMKFQTTRLYRFARFKKRFPLYHVVDQWLHVRTFSHIIKHGRPFLSSDHVLEDRLCRLEGKLDDFKHDFAAGKFDS